MCRVREGCLTSVPLTHNLLIYSHRLFPSVAGLSEGNFTSEIRRSYAAAIDQAAGTSLGSTTVASVAAPSSSASSSGRKLLG